MARTTVDAVEAIIDIDSGISLTPFIEMANSLVTEVCAGQTDTNGTEYTAARLELIERWLAAHAYHIRDTRADRKELGDGNAKYRSKIDMGFNLTHYGQMALRLDTNGGLAQLDQSTEKGGATTVGLSWLGKTETESLES